MKHSIMNTNDMVQFSSVHFRWMELSEPTGKETVDPRANVNAVEKKDCVSAGNRMPVSRPSRPQRGHCTS